MSKLSIIASIGVVAALVHPVAIASTANAASNAAPQYQVASKNQKQLPPHFNLPDIIAAEPQYEQMWTQDVGVLTTKVLTRSAPVITHTEFAYEQMWLELLEEVSHPVNP